MNPEIKILNEPELKKIFDKLNNNYGIDMSTLPKNSKLIQRGKEKIFLFTGYIDEKEIQKLKEFSSIELIGLTIGKIDLFDNNKKEDIRLTLEGTHIFKNSISKNIVELSDLKLIEEWMMGRELLFEDIENAISLNSNTPSGGRVTSRLEVSDGGGVGSRVEGEVDGLSEIGQKIKSLRPKGFVVIKNSLKGDFLGTGKASAQKITNFIPKGRRLKERS